VNEFVATLVLAALAHAQDGQTPPVATEAPATAPVPHAAAAADTVYGYTRYKDELDRLVRDFSSHARIERLGESRQGRELSLVVVSDQRGRDAAQKPALLVCAELGAPDGGARSARAIVDTARQLLSRATTDPRLAALLEGCTVYFIPVLDPDRAFGETRPSAAARDEGPRLAVDFPIDWRPEPERFTPYPLSEPESRAAVALLRSRANLSAVLMFTNRPRATRANPLADASRIDSLDRLDASTARLLPYAAAVHAPGSLEAYCEGRLGQRVYFCTPWSAPNAEGEPALDLPGAQRCVESLAADLPRLVCDPPNVERLRANLWLVDASIHNTGRLPTALDSALARRSGLDVRLRTSGAKIVGIAQQRSGGGFESLAYGGDTCRLGNLGGGDGITIRLVVEAQENSSLELAFDAPRAGESRVLVPLL
jgi:hypothetical protein